MLPLQFSSIIEKKALVNKIINKLNTTYITSRTQNVNDKLGPLLCKRPNNRAELTILQMAMVIIYTPRIPCHFQECARVPFLSQCPTSY